MTDEPSEPKTILLRDLVARANAGDTQAMVRVGIAYRDADGVGSDLVQAARWFFLALAHGNGDGIHELRLCARRMTDQELLSADELAGGNGSWARAAIATWHSENHSKRN